MFFDDPAAAFGNLRAALRPGGRLAFLCWQPDERNELFAIPLRALAVHTGQPQPGDADRFADPDWITRLLTGAGFADVRIVPVNEPARLGDDVPDVMGYTLGMVRVRGMLAELDGADAARVRDTMAELYAARRRPDGVWVEASAWLVTATA
jgi:hypothetical protein